MNIYPKRSDTLRMSTLIYIHLTLINNIILLKYNILLRKIGVK